MASPAISEYRFLSWLAACLIRGIVCTCRIFTLNETGSFKPETIPSPAIYIFWHCHIFMMIPHFQHRDAHPLISHSEDGSLVAAVAKRFRMDPIRGSSSQGGARAFLELVDCLITKREDVLITADGPKGPARIIKEGVVRLAEKTTFPVIPVSWYGNRVFVFRKSWDHFIVPLPFSRVYLMIGAPLQVATMGNPQTSLADTLNDLEERVREKARPGKTNHKEQQ